MIGIGFAEKTGLFKALFTTSKIKISKFWLTFIVVLVSILSTIIGDIGFVLIIPLAAIIFLANNRNPIIGIIASFVAMTTGYGVNLFITQMDYNLFQISDLSSKIIDSTYSVSINGNVVFSIVITILLTFLISFITEKFITKKAKKYKIDEDFIDEQPLNDDSKKALRYVYIFVGLAALFFVYMLIPIGTPLSGLLLDYTQKTFYGRVFSPDSYVIQGLAFMISATLIITGWIYGTVAKTLKSKNDFSNYLYGSLNNIGSILVLFFFASQLIAIFKKTNLGTVFTIKVVDIVTNSNFSGAALIILFFVLLSIVNLFQTSSVTKWSILAPSLIPLFMKANISPEFTQAIFRAGDSITNTITPLFPYFVVLIGMLQLYNKQEEAIGIKYTYKLLLPYTIGITIFWLLILLTWYIINLPIGIGIFPIL
jgi:aminobenzoyl-glutamate transport protein